MAFYFYRNLFHHKFTTTQKIISLILASFDMLLFFWIIISQPAQLYIFNSGIQEIAPYVQAMLAIFYWYNGYLFISGQTKKASIIYFASIPARAIFINPSFWFLIYFGLISAASFLSLFLIYALAESIRVALTVVLFKQPEAN